MASPVPLIRASWMAQSKIDANATALAERFHLAFSKFLSEWNSYVLMG